MKTQISTLPYYLSFCTKDQGDNTLHYTFLVQIVPIPCPMLVAAVVALAFAADIYEYTGAGGGVAKKWNLRKTLAKQAHKSEEGVLAKAFADLDADTKAIGIEGATSGKPKKTGEFHDVPAGAKRCTEAMMKEHSALAYFSACNQLGHDQGSGLPWMGENCSPCWQEMTLREKYRYLGETWPEYKQLTAATSNVQLIPNVVHYVLTDKGACVDGCASV
jgi:hypothetical protein